MLKKDAIRCMNGEANDMVDLTKTNRLTQKMSLRF